MREWLQAEPCTRERLADPNKMNKQQMAAELRVLYNESGEGTSDELKKRLRAARKRAREEVRARASAESSGGEEQPATKACSGNAAPSSPARGPAADAAAMAAGAPNR